MSEKQRLNMLKKKIGHMDVTDYQDFRPLHPAPKKTRFEGKDESLYISPIIIGAHLESVNAWFLALARSPGADDDGSGTVTTLEVFRSLINIGYHPVRSIEFHWYSAEEAGLLGSQDVAEDYRCKSVEVLAMIQMRCPFLWIR
ncbi:Leucine aminopeptidase 1 [Haplosporangium sp. Z 11]|nr:Leucine aminopeptidase 1 [Haplosporangium sp. Z 11]